MHVMSRIVFMGLGIAMTGDAGEVLVGTVESEDGFISQRAVK